MQARSRWRLHSGWLQTSKITRPRARAILHEHISNAQAPVLRAEVPKTHTREIRAIFPDIEDLSDMLIVPTCQHSRMELVNTGDDVDQEKDDLLETFAEWAGQVCKVLGAQGHWCDFIDPCSGLPVRSYLKVSLTRC